MRLLKRMNTVFYRLVFSYFVLIIITTIFMGITSYVYYTKSFNEEIEKVNGRMLSYVKKITDENIFRKTERIYIDITIPQSGEQLVLSLFDRPLAGNHASISEVYKHLKEIVSLNSDLIESIQVYYKANNLVISSTHGVRFLDDDPSGIESIPWLYEVNRQFKDVLAWYHFDGTVALIGSYPYSDAEDSLGYVAVILKESALPELLTDTAGDASGVLMVIEPNGIVSAGLESTGLALSSSHIDEIMAARPPEQYYLTEIDGNRSMISYTTLDRTGWRLVNVTPVDQFYQKSETVQRTILIICIAALLIGGVISNIFTLNIYNPLRPVIDRTRKLFHDTGHHGKSEPENEYKMINDVIDNLSVKVSDLEKTLSGNIPLIRSKLVEELLRGKFDSVDEINERLSLVGLEPVDRYHYFNVISLQFDEFFMDHIKTENSEFIKYNLLDLIESSMPFQGMCLAVEDDYVIHMVVGSKHKSQEALYNVAHYLMTYAYSNFMISMTASIGTWTDDLTRINEVYAEAQTNLKYRYFKPRQKILAGWEYVERERSKQELDDGFMEQFRKALKLRDEKKAGDAVKRFVTELSQGCYNAEYAQDRIKEFIYQYYSYVKSMNVSTREILDDRLLSDFYQFAHIDQLERWLLDVIKVTFEYFEDKQKHRSTELIDKIKTYIIEHLHEDLSLNAIAEVVYLSPRYLSRIFKQETGENFVDFVTRVRMEKAKELLLDSDMNIEQIAQSLSYNHPAYFTKKFKEVYGMTPSSYRLRDGRDHPGV